MHFSKLDLPSRSHDKNITKSFIYICHVILGCIVVMREGEREES